MQPLWPWWQGSRGRFAGDLSVNNRTLPGSSTAVQHGADRIGAFVGPYRLESVLGEGGFGVVYEAEQTHPIRRRVALKVIKLGMDTREFVARFEAERQTLAALDHPHIAKVLGAGATDDGRPYFVMELVRGEPINEYCDHHQLSVAQRIELFVQVVEAVQHAHDSGVIHRDLKPNNLIVATHDDRPFVKVIDFGIAKMTGERAAGHEAFTHVGDIIGTPMYMSPEQLGGGGPIDVRSDVFSLGVVLYQLLTGSTPLPPSTFASVPVSLIHGRVIETDPPRPSTRLRESVATLSDFARNCGVEPRTLTRTIKGELDWVVMRALEKDPVRRYQTARELTDDLRRFLAGEAVLAVPPSLGYRLSRRLKKKRESVAWVAMSLTLIVALFVPAWWGSDRSTAAAEKSIAVLPFGNLSADPHDAFFALGIHDAVMTQLTRVAELRVISRASVMAYDGTSKGIRQIGEELGVAMILGGTVSRSGLKMRVSVNLNDAQTDTVRWSDQFDVELTASNLFEIQTRITEEIAARLGSSLSNRERDAISTVDTQSTEAYAAFLRGKALGRYGENTLDEIEQSIAAFDTAIAADPRFAAAHSAKAVAHVALAWGNRSRDLNLTAARRSLDSATLLARNSAETYVAQATYFYRGLLDYGAAEAASAKALSLEPNNAEAWLIRALAARRDLRLSEAVEAFQRIVELDPLRVSSAADLAYTLAVAGRLAEARHAAESALKKGPDHPYVLGVAVTVALWSNDRAGAWTYARRMPKLDSEAYDYFRSTYALYSRDASELNVLMQGWPAPRGVPPYFDYFDLVRVFVLRQLGQEADAARLLGSVREHLELTLQDSPRLDEERKLQAATLALAQDRSKAKAALAELLADPPKDKLWLAEEGFVLLAALAAAGENADALDLVEVLMDDCSPAQFARVLLAPSFDGLRDEPRYRMLEARYRAWLESNGQS